jgi:hypothetical protein
MSILGNIFGKIFGRDDNDNDHQATSTGEKSATGGKPMAGGMTKGDMGGKSMPTGVQLDEADVEVILSKKAEAKGEALNWKTSIVDLMKTLDIDSSLENRKALADELGYSGDKSDSAAMNVWLHRQVMNKIAANGGKVPADLVD